MMLCGLAPAFASDKPAAEVNFMVFRPKPAGCGDASANGAVSSPVVGVVARQSSLESPSSPITSVTSNPPRAEGNGSGDVNSSARKGEGKSQISAQSKPDANGSPDGQAANKMAGEGKLISSIGAGAATTSAGAHADGSPKSAPAAASSCLVPMRNAMVVLHPVDKDGKQANGGFELKTNGEGHAEIGSISYGRLRVQVIAPGFQTYGEDFLIDQPEKTIRIVLQRPKDQYSIYK